MADRAKIFDLTNRNEKKKTKKFYTIVILSTLSSDPRSSKAS